MDEWSSFDDSSISLASVDPNPTQDQVGDGGSSENFSSILQTVQTFGTHLTDSIIGAQSQQRQPAQYYPGGAPMTRPPGAMTSKEKTGMILFAIVIAGLGVWWFSSN